MNPQVALIFKLFLYVLIGLVIARSLMTWFPVRRDNQFVRFLNTATEPLLEPLRRLLPRTGMIDFSAMILIILLYIMIFAVDRATAA